MKPIKHVMAATASVTVLISGAGIKAQASPEATAIIDKMIEAELRREAATGAYYTLEQSKMGDIQGVYLYMSPCDTARYNYAKVFENSSGKSKGKLANSDTVKQISNLCSEGPLLGYSMVRPMEIEYMLEQGDYSMDYKTSQAGLSALSKMADPRVGGDAGFDIAKFGTAATTVMDRHFSLEDLKQDIRNARQQFEDLKAFGKKADVVRETNLDGRGVWVILAQNLKQKQKLEKDTPIAPGQKMSSSGTATIDTAMLVIDQKNLVPLGMFTWGTLKQGKHTSSFYVRRTDENYSNVEGGEMMLPFSSSMVLSLKIEDPKLKKELEKARAEYEKAKKMLDDPSIAQNAMARNMIQKQLDKMGEMIEQNENMHASTGEPTDEELKEIFKQNADQKKSEMEQAEQRQKMLDRIFDGSPVGNIRKIKFAKRGGVEAYLQAVTAAQSQ